MKNICIFLASTTLFIGCKNSNTTSTKSEPVTTSEKEVFEKEPVKKQLYIDAHHLGAGNVTAEAVADVHLKDLAVQDKYDVNFIEYWVNEESGTVYCLSEAPAGSQVSNTHKEAHGLVPDEVFLVSEGDAAKLKGNSKLYLDIHDLGAGNVTAEAVADAHVKDLDVQGKNNVNFINYWVDESNGKVFCLSESPSATAVRDTHAEAHGLLPDEIMEVILGK